MLYGGPLGTYLSGYYAPGSTKSGSPSYTSTGSGPTSSTSLSRSRSSRYRAPSAFGTPSSGTNSSVSLITPSSSRSSYYTPQTRRKYSDDSTESPLSNRSRYTTSGNPVNNSVSSSGGTNANSGAGSSGYYSRPSPSYTSFSSTPSAVTIPPSPSSYARAATLSPYNSMHRRARSQDRSRWLQEAKFYSTRGYFNGWDPNLDYKRLYEAERQDTQELRGQIDRAQAELRELRARLEEARRMPSQQQQQQQHQNPSYPHSNNNSDTDQRVLEELRTTSEKLKAEHRALTRVISRLM